MTHLLYLTDRWVSSLPAVSQMSVGQMDFGQKLLNHIKVDNTNES